MPISPEEIKNLQETYIVLKNGLDIWGPQNGLTAILAAQRLRVLEVDKVNFEQIEGSEQAQIIVANLMELLHKIAHAKTPKDLAQIMLVMDVLDITTGID